MLLSYIKFTFFKPMEKGQKLRVKTPESSTILPKSFAAVEFTRDSSILIPPKITNEPNETNEEISVDFSNEYTPIKLESTIKNEKKRMIKEKGIDFIKKYGIYSILILIIIFLWFKPADYEFLIEEIESLKNIKTIPKKSLENIADITYGASVSKHSEIYKYGFFKSIKSDPNSIFETGLTNFSLEKNNGFIEIKFKLKFKISKIGIYHPEIANFKSSIENFSILMKDKKYNFKYSGNGYEEFSFEELETDLLRIEWSSNHGESKYTCIYRIFVYSLL